MSKITKRILSILLALVLVVSGVLSGIPGGGVVRGEETGDIESSVAETVEDASTASLGADIAEWDVGAEVVGDGFVEKEAEENGEETLTDTKIETNDLSNSDSGVSSNTEQTDEESESTQTNDIYSAGEKNFIEEEKDVINEGEILNEEEGDVGDVEGLAGYNTTFHIMIDIDTSNTEYIEHNGQNSKWSSTMSKLYFSSWLDSNTGDEYTDSKDKDSSSTSEHSVFSFQSNSNRNRVRFFSEKVVTNGAEASSYSGTSWTATQTKNITPANNDQDVYLKVVWRDGDNQNLKVEDWDGVVPASITQAPSNPATSFTIYYDASLSSINKSRAGTVSTEGKECIPEMAWNPAGYRAHYGIASNDSLYNNRDYYGYPKNPVYLVMEHSYTTGGKTYNKVYYTGERVTDTFLNSSTDGKRSGANNKKGTMVYKFTVDKSWITNDTIIYFSNSTNSTAGPGCTGKVKFPSNMTTANSTNAKFCCFYGDSGDPCQFDNSNRGGYWDTLKGPHDPERRTQAGEFYNGIGVDTNSVVVLSGGTKPVTDQENGTLMVFPATLYDYYSDYELSGKRRYESDADNTNGNGSTGDARGYRNFYRFMNFDKALTAAYDAANEPIALYTGHFQPRTDWYWGTWCNYENITNNDHGNWLFDYYNATGKGGDQKFYIVNNSGVSTGSTQVSDYNQVVQGLVNQTRPSETVNNIKVFKDPKTNSDAITLPYLDSSLLNGGNVLNTKLARTYPEVDIPFWQDVRDSGSGESGAKIDYYVFAAEYHLLSDGNKATNRDSSYKIPKSTRYESNNGKGDWGVLHNNSGDYFITSSKQDAKDGYKNLDSNSGTNTSMGFFPFNEEVGNAAQNSATKYNYGYLMKFELDFTLKYNGKVTDYKPNDSSYTGKDVPMIFRFSGDDDVWVFIDDQLALDLGGAHGASSGYIDFSNNNTSYANLSTITAQAVVESGIRNGVYTKADQDNNNSNTAGTFFTTTNKVKNFPITIDKQEYTKHKLTMYYMERGQWESNMMIEFNLPAEPVDTPKVDLVLNKVWNPASKADSYSSVKYRVYQNDPDKVETKGYKQVRIGEYTLTAPDWTVTVPNQEAFVDRKVKNKRYIYSVYEVYTENGQEKDALIGHVGDHENGNEEGKEATSTNGENKTVLLTQSDGTTTETLGFTGIADVIKNPYKPTGTANDAVNGTYIYTGYNGGGAITVRKSWEYWDGEAYVTVTPEAWKPVKVQLQRRVRSSNGAWTNILDPVVLASSATAAENWQHTFTVTEVYDSSGNLYEFRVVELSADGTAQEEETGSYYFADETNDNTDNPTYHEAPDFKVYYSRDVQPATSPTTTAVTSPTGTFTDIVDSTSTDSTTNAGMVGLKAGTAGNYKLMANVTISTASAITLQGDIALDLNGYKLTFADANTYFKVPAGKKLTVFDSSTNKWGTILNYTTFAEVDGGTVEFLGGTIDGKDMGSTPPTYGGAFYLKTGASSLVMKGSATIRNTKAANGGAVYLVAQSSFTMEGGNILDCTASTSGGGVYVGGTAGSTQSLLTLDGSANPIVFKGNKATSGNGGPIYNSGRLSMKGSIDIGDGVSTAAPNSPGHVDSVCLADISWTYAANAAVAVDAATGTNWIDITGPLNVFGDGYIDLETNLPASGIAGHTFARNASPTTGDGHVDEATFCSYGRYFVNSALGLGASGGYDYEAPGNFDTTMTPAALHTGTTTPEDNYPAGWTSTASDTDTTQYAYTNAAGDRLYVQATAGSDKYVYQSEKYLVFTKGKTSADSATWDITITNKDEPIAAYVAHTYYKTSSTQEQYSTTSSETNAGYVDIATSLYYKSLGSLTENREDATHQYTNNESSGWTAFTAPSSWVTYRASTLSFDDKLTAHGGYYGWRSELVENLPAHNASMERLEYRFIAGTQPDGFTQSVSSKWYASGASNGGTAGSLLFRLLAPSSESTLDANVYRTDIEDVPTPFKVTAVKRLVGLDNNTLTGKDSATVRLALLRTAAASDSAASSAADSAWVVMAVTNHTFGSGMEAATHTFEWADQLRSDGTNRYYYKVVELNPSATLSVEAGTTTYNSISSHAVGTSVKLGDGYYYTVSNSPLGVTVAPVTDATLSMGTITNKVKPGKIVITKVDQGDSNTKIEGAVFTLYNSDDSGTGISGTTNSSGVTTLDLSSLSNGTYKLVETSTLTTFQKQLGYAQVTIGTDGTITVSAQGHFVIASGGTQSVVESASDATWPTVAMTIADPRKVTISVTKTVSPVLKTGESMTVYLKLKRKYTDSSSQEVVDNSFAVQTVSLGAGENTKTFTCSAWTNIDRYSPDGTLYTYYVEEYSATGSKQNTITKTLKTDTNRTYAVDYSSASYAINDNSTTAISLRIENRSVDAQMVKTWVNDTADNRQPIIVRLQRKTSAFESGDESDGNLTVQDWTITKGSGGPTISPTSSTTTNWTVSITKNSDDNQWTLLAEGLPAGASDGSSVTDYHYRFIELDGSTPLSEDAINDNYKVTYSDVSASGTYPASTETSGVFTTGITNTYQKTKVKVIKYWLQSDGSTAKISDLPTNLTVQLQSDEATENTYVDYSGSVTVTLAWDKTNAGTNGEWHYASAEILPKYNDNRLINYRYVETVPAGYEQVTGTAGGHTAGSSFDSGSNTHTTTLINKQKIINITVEKKFLDKDGKDFNITSRATLPTVYLRLQRTTANDWTSGVEDVATITLPESTNSYQHIFNGQKLADNDGNYYRYRVIEVDGDTAGASPVSETDAFILGDGFSYKVVYNQAASGQAISIVSSTGQLTSSSTAASLQVGNKLQPVDLRIQKMKEDGTTPLDGAVFLLATSSSATTGTEKTTGQSPDITGEATFTGLSTGTTYYLSEKTAPAGFVKQPGYVKVTIAADGSMTFDAESTGFVFTDQGATAATVSANRLYTISVNNIPANIKIDILKLEEGTYSGPQKKLGGAVFKLEKTSSPAAEWTFSATDATTGMTDMGNGHIDPAITDGIGDGMYTLREITAPSGYNLNNAAITFEVSGGKIVSVTNPTGSSLVTANFVETTSGSGVFVPPYNESDNIKTYHFVFENSTGAELPGTGTVFGLSRMGFASLGTVLLAAFVVVYQYKKRRQYNGEDEEI